MCLNIYKIFLWSRNILLLALGCICMNFDRNYQLPPRRVSPHLAECDRAHLPTSHGYYQPFMFLLHWQKGSLAAVPWAPGKLSILHMIISPPYFFCEPPIHSHPLPIILLGCLFLFELEVYTYRY